jgi:hypothetical protein
MRVHPKVSGLAAWSENCKWCSCIAILWVSLVSFAATIVCVASQRVFIVVVFVVYFVIDSVQKLLDTPSYVRIHKHTHTHTQIRSSVKNL